MKSLQHFAFISALFWVMTASAHPPDASGHHHAAPQTLRNWTIARTGETVRASFLAARRVDGVIIVTLEHDDGDTQSIPFGDLAPTDQQEARRRISEIADINDHLAFAAAAQPNDLPRQPPVRARPEQANPFDVFAPLVTTRWDDRWLYVESDGLPHVPGGTKGSFVFSHPLMVGITAWQQQVPLPQNYRAANAWQIPLHPVFADQPVSAKQQLFRGAIALAANGVPIFNPIKNDGRTDTFLAGELDEFGGHCGRADDYHYHIAPTHLQKFVGKKSPVAYALDGFPVFGFFDPASRPGTENACPLGGTDKLDELNGHVASPAPDAKPGENGLYHYHASNSYPYLNGGMRGVVTVRDDQIDPQPHAAPVRDWLQPLRGARITGFKSTGDRAWSLEYAIGRKPGFVNYSIEGDGRDARCLFEFVSPDGTTKSATYSARAARDDNPRPAQDRLPPRDNKPDNPPPPAPGGFTLSSADVDAGRLSVDCTCDGQSRPPALRWTDPPANTRSFAIAMHHIPPDGSTHVYMVVANLPPEAREFRGDPAAGLWGPNTVNRRNQYAPPCSQGPGDKVYTITLYALSADVNTDGPLTRDALLAAIKDSALASASLEVKYARQNNQPDQRGKNPNNRRQRADRNDAPAEGDHQGLRARMTAFKTDVPAHDIDVILARPTDRSITVSVHAADAAKATVEYWPESGGTRRKSPPIAVAPDAVTNIELAGLSPGTEYHYRLGLAKKDQPIEWGDDNRFRTRPAPGTPFTFVIQADSHLDQSVEPAVYEQTLANMLAARPDFLVDLGDTFMTDQRGRDFQSARPQYDAQRFYFGQIARSAPLFMVLGNHDGEKGSSGTGPDDIGPWSFNERTSRFPAPAIDGRNYTGNTSINNGIGANYYAFDWGDAQFIILDPFWASTDRIRGGGRGQDRQGEQRNDQPLAPSDASWGMTLGQAQYDWLTKTLESSKARYRFVFIHHLVGGMGGPESRGGVESSRYFEWGGNTADGTPGFAEHRPGWALPIHDLLAKHHVSAVFHGHDHMYVQSERDGITYQCVPQPGNPVGNTRSAGQYGYKSGTILASPGHLRVEVGPDQTHVTFVRTAVADAEGHRRNSTPTGKANGTVVRRYDIKPSLP